MQIISYFNKSIKRLKWRLFQPLTLLPRNNESSISDLFYWVVNDEWETFFDLSPIIMLFRQNLSQDIEKILLVIYDKNGVKIISKLFVLDCIKRQTLKISELFEEKIIGEGTFAVFHLGRPDLLKKKGAFIAERGYLSFSFNGNKIRSYVHGNMDAVALQSNGEMQYLGNAFIWKREYRLQYLLGDSRKSKIVLVNSYRKKLEFTLRLFNADSGALLSIKKIYAGSGGVVTFEIPPTIKEKVYLVIESKSIMARPVVMDYQTQGVNVFHG